MRRYPEQASPTSILCLSNYDDTRAVLDGADEHLQGKTVVQLSSGRPAEAQALSEYVTAVGGAYLDGSIMSFPHEVGTDDLLVFYSGDAETFEEVEPLLEALGGSASHVGEDPRGAAIREWALNVPFGLAHVGLSHGAKICEREDVPLDWYTTAIQKYISRMTDQLLLGLRDSEIPTDPKEMDGVRWAEGAADMATYLHKLDIDPRMHEVLYDMFATGVEDVPREPETLHPAAESPSKSIEAHQATVRQALAAWDDRDMETIDQVFKEDVINHGADTRGLETLKNLYAEWYEAFPDLTHTVKDVFGSGDHVAVRFTLTGTHEASLQDLAPTEESIEVGGNRNIQAR